MFFFSKKDRDGLARLDLLHSFYLHSVFFIRTSPNEFSLRAYVVMSYRYQVKNRKFQPDVLIAKVLIKIRV